MMLMPRLIIPVPSLTEGTLRRQRCSAVDAGEQPQPAPPVAMCWGCHGACYQMEAAL